jgi:TonB family protein
VRIAGSCFVLAGFGILPVIAQAQDAPRMTRVIIGGPVCPPVVLQPAGIDSAAVAPLMTELTASLTKRFRPPAPDDTVSRLVLTVSSDDIRMRVAGIYDTRIPPAVRLAVAGAKAELAQFKAKPGATPIEFAASFAPPCVTEFPLIEAPPAQPAYFEFQVTQTVRQLSGHPPAYPPALLEAHIGGHVLVQFVVDTTGRPEMRTFKVLMSSNPMFADAVREALPSMRYEPAKLQGRRVRQVVQQPFNFAER